MVKDMTVGSPTRLLVGFSVPMIIGNIFQQFYSMVDAIVVGKFVGVDALAAIGATGSFNYLILGFVIGLTSGFSVIIAQRFGAGDEAGVKRATAMSVLLSAAITVIITAVSMLLTEPVLAVMQTPENIMQDACGYMYVIFGGTAATLFFNLVSSVLRALGDSKTPLYILVVASILNVLLDLLFVLKYNMGVIGTAYATVIAQAISCILCVIYIICKLPILRLKRSDFDFNGASCLQLLKMGLPTGGCASVTGIGGVVLQGAINGFGSDVVAAFTSGGRVENLMIQPAYSFGMASAAYVGQNMGARKMDRIQAGVRKSVVICIVICVALGLVEILFGEYLVQIFVSGEETVVIYYAKYYLIVSGIFLPVLALLNIYRNAVQGLGNGMIPLLCGVLELVSRVGVAWFLVEPLGYLGVCLASPVAWFTAFLLSGVYFYKILRNLRSDPSLTHG